MGEGDRKRGNTRCVQVARRLPFDKCNRQEWRSWWCISFGISLKINLCDNSSYWKSPLSLLSPLHMYPPSSINFCAAACAQWTCSPVFSFQFLCAFCRTNCAAHQRRSPPRRRRRFLSFPLLSLLLCRMPRLRFFVVPPSVLMVASNVTLRLKFRSNEV